MNGDGSTADKRRRYGLAWNPRPQQVAGNALLCAVLSAISIVVSWLAVVTIPGGFVGVGALYFASIYYAICTYWFGGWGILASFIGAFVGSGLLAGMPAPYAVVFAMADIWEPLLPFLFLRTVGQKLGVEPLGSNLTRPVNWAMFALYGAALPPFASGLWGVWILTASGLVTARAFWPAVISWWLGACILLLVFVPPICNRLGDFIERRDLACHGIWS